MSYSFLIGWLEAAMPYLIGFGFTAWLLFLSKDIKYLAKVRSSIDKLQNTERLIAARKEQEDIQPSREELNQLFHSAIRSSSSVSLTRESGPIVFHLQTIFMAGCKESRLDVNELLAFTKARIFKHCNTLRSTLSLFLISGLLGTLAGISNCLAGLGPALGKTAIQNAASGLANDKADQALQALLGNLNSAFVPSCIGVVTTIASILLYSLVYQRKYCAPLSMALDQATLATWVPALYPTSTQKLVEALPRVQQMFENGAEHVGKVNELCRETESYVEKFNGHLQTADAAGRELDKAVQAITTAGKMLSHDFVKDMVGFTESFGTHVNRLTSFQNELGTLYKTMVSESDAFRKNVKETLEDQGKQSRTMLKALKSYESAYIEQRREIDSHLTAFLSEATNANTSANAQAIQAIQAMSDILPTQFQSIGIALNSCLEKLDDTLSKQLASMNERTEARLLAVAESLDSMASPLKQSADAITASQENFSKNLKEQIHALVHHSAELNDKLGKVLEKNDKTTDKLAQELRKVVAALESSAGNRRPSRIRLFFAKFFPFLNSETASE